MNTTNSDLYSKLAIIIPSKIDSEERYNFAKTSFQSLTDNLKNINVSHVVAHDKPSLLGFVPNNLHFLIKPLKWNNKTKSLYNASDTIWTEGNGKGSAAALLLAVDIALSKGKTFGFIHLDDHVYCEPFGKLITSGLNAMEQDANLLWTRYSGYPIMHDGRVPLKIDNTDHIAFDHVKLSPLRKNDYTLWRSPIISDVNEGNYWPVALWFCIYRLPVLKKILEWAIAVEKKHLGHTENFFKNENGFVKLANEYPKGSFGYINMQFGGFEMHRNKNWKELLKMENKGII